MRAVPQASVNPTYPFYSWQLYQPYRSHIYPHYVIAYPPVYPPSFVNERFSSLQGTDIRDFGKEPFVVDIEQVTKQNNTFRTALWTGAHFQVTVMSIPVGSDIGLEVHPNTDQFIRIEEGQSLVQMGNSRERLDFEAKAQEGYAIMIPAGKWHNVTNTGNKPLKVYVIYAPPQHPFGTVHPTKADAMASH
ncbi:cupin domain-containing protein [Paenibacillus rigui]|uniref:Cupin n=1 Tax=Paenibacillus rigui TaxID=554312 RepID=A0A229UJK9_9BACL|nr:cupin domain-containing protein [Paenibacillus rigui]OXM83079.1 cupin [Paenibacillus rigui]